MRPPLTFAYCNLVFGAGIDDAWALYRLETRSYAGLSAAHKREVFASLAAFAYAVEADFSVLRVTRAWSPDGYADAAGRLLDGRHGHADRWHDYLESHRAALADRAAAAPEVYVSVRLTTPRQETGGPRSAFTGAIEGLRRMLGLDDPRALGHRQLDAMLSEEDKLFARLGDYLDAERASTLELQWLVRRAFCRGLGEPGLDERFRPQALVFADESDELRYRPLEHDLLRLADAPITIGPRGLRIDSEAGESHQALLVLGALPEVVAFPGPAAELLFAPLEAVDFPVDACFSARYVANDHALALARRRIVDADHAHAEESHGDHGPTAGSRWRPEAARELEEYLTAGAHPPLLRASISLAVGAPSAEELERRVERLRREYGSVCLHRPLGEELRLFISHLPAQFGQVPDYDDYLLVEQFAAMVPIATHAVGSELGPYLGHTLSGSRQPVLFDLTEGPRTSRPPAILLAGTLGSGKTLALQLLLYQAFLAGSQVIDIDPKGDHRVHELPEVSEHTELIELSPDPRYQGMLDPLRIGPEDGRADLAHSFLLDLLPAPVPGPWQTEVRLAVESVLAGGGRTCDEVVAALEAGNEHAREAARAIAVHTGSGLLRLGFGRHDVTPPEAGSRQLTSIRIANLVLPLPGTPKAELSSDERIGQALLRLLAAYALHLSGSDWSRHKAIGFDEAWMLLGDSAGRALVQRINRLGRSHNATPLLATQALGDVAELENLLGVVFAFGVETDDEARRVLALLRLDGEDARLRQQLVSFRRGRCLLKDYSGRVGAMQVDLVDPDLRAALDTTPSSAARSGREGARDVARA